jgi:hypothetical protein
MVWPWGGKRGAAAPGDVEAVPQGTGAGAALGAQQRVSQAADAAQGDAPAAAARGAAPEAGPAPAGTSGRPPPQQQQQQQLQQRQHQQQQQPPPPQKQGAEPQQQPACDGGNCFMHLVVQKEYCKAEFAAFDNCFDAVEAGRKEESECLPLVGAAGRGLRRGSRPGPAGGRTCGELAARDAASGDTPVTELAPPSPAV